MQPASPSAAEGKATPSAVWQGLASSSLLVLHATPIYSFYHNYPENRPVGLFSMLMEMVDKTLQV